MIDISHTQRKLRTPDRTCQPLKDEGGQSKAIVVIWVGSEAARIVEVAELLGKESHEFVRWAVDDVTREATFSSAKERDREGRPWA